MDRESVYTLSIGFGRGTHDENNDPDGRQVIQQKLVDFILQFEIDGVFLYRYTICQDAHGQR